jgi:hypothetical protein
MLLLLLEVVVAPAQHHWEGMAVEPALAPPAVLLLPLLPLDLQPPSQSQEGVVAASWTAAAAAAQCLRSLLP